MNEVRLSLPETELWAELRKLVAEDQRAVWEVVKDLRAELAEFRIQLGNFRSVADKMGVEVEKLVEAQREAKKTKSQIWVATIPGLIAVLLWVATLVAK